MSSAAAFTNRLHAIEASLRELVQDAAVQFGKLTMQSSFADGYWSVTLHADGTTTYDGYAEETRGARGHLADLTAWELVELASALPRLEGARR